MGLWLSHTRLKIGWESPCNYDKSVVAFSSFLLLVNCSNKLVTQRLSIATPTTSGWPWLIARWMDRLPGGRQPVSKHQLRLVAFTLQTDWQRAANNWCVIYKHGQCANTLQSIWVSVHQWVQLTSIFFSNRGLVSRLLSTCAILQLNCHLGATTSLLME